MKFILPFVVFGSLLVVGCEKQPTTIEIVTTNGQEKQSTQVVKKREMRPETLSYLTNTNQVACIGGVLYFTTWGESGPIIGSPVIDQYRVDGGITYCKNGIPIERFGKLY